MEEIRDSNGRFVKGMKRSAESKRNQSETMHRQYDTRERTAWQEGQTKETNPSLAQAAAKMKGRVPANKGKKVSEDPKLAEAHRKSVETRKKNGWKQPEEAKQQIRATMKARADEWRERRKKQHFVREGNGLEQLMWVAFDKLEIPYAKNPRIYGASGQLYKADIVIGKVDVECDGRFFHCPVRRPWQVEHDAKRDADLQKNGYLVIRLKEEDIRRDPMAQALKVREVLLSQPYNGTDTSQPNGNTDNHTSDS